MKIRIDFSNNLRFLIDVNPSEKLAMIINSLITLNYSSLSNLDFHSFSCHNVCLDLFKTLLENNVKDGDIISIMASEKQIYSQIKVTDEKKAENEAKMNHIVNDNVTNIIELKVEIREQDIGIKKFQKANVNKKVFFLADKERSSEYYDDNTTYDEFNEQNSELFIDGEKVKFSKYYVFKDVGIHNIKYIIKKEIRNCKSLFCYCHDITYIDLSQFDTEFVDNMQFMFNSCKNLTKITFNNVKTENVLDMGYMFQCCSALCEIDIHEFDMSNVKDVLFMFSGVSQKGSIKVNKDIEEKIKCDSANLPKNWSVITL